MSELLDMQYDGDISGDGSFVKSGAGRLTLTGENTWDGTTTVEGGTLRAGSATALPQVGGGYVVNGGTLDLNDTDLTVTPLSGSGGQIVLGTTGNGTLTLSQDDDTTAAAAITGAGRIVKSGIGTLTLTGDSTITGGTEYTETTVVREGTLAVQGSGAKLTQSASAIYAGRDATDTGTFEVRDGAVVSSARAYIGYSEHSTGHALVTGSGAEWNSATSFAVGYGGTGALTISDGGKITTAEMIIGHQGGLASGTAVVTGAGSELAAGALYIGNETTGFLTVANGGTVTVTGGAGTALVGANPGVYAILDIGTADGLGTAGTVNAAAVQFNSTEGYLRFNQTDNITFSQPISGPGQVVHQGVGTTTLTGAGTYTGLTTVEAGALYVNGSILGNTVVKYGATFGGDGVVGDILLESGAQLRPLDSFDAGSLVWNPGASLIFRLGNGSSDILELDADLTKDGDGTFAFTFENDDWQVGETYTLIVFANTNFTESDFSFTNDVGFSGTFAIEGNAVTFHVVAVPEPSTWALCMAALLSGVVLARRRKIRHA